MLDVSAAVVKAMESGIILGWRSTCRINFEEAFEASDNNMAQKQLLWGVQYSAAEAGAYFGILFVRSLVGFGMDDGKIEKM